MDFEKIKITEIVPAEYNPRVISKDEFKKLSNSISHFGLVDPIIINLKNNKIIGGHQRYDVLLNQYMRDNSFYEELNILKLGDIGWCFTDTDLKVESEDNEKALNLALNKISGEWEFEKLNIVLDDLSANEFNVEVTGFDVDDKDIIKIKDFENNQDNMANQSRKHYTEKCENVTFQIGSYSFKIPFWEYEQWKSDLVNGSMENNGSVEDILLSRLGLNDLIGSN